MYSPDDEAVEPLTTETCWELLSTAQVGRLALAAGGDIDIFPINFVAHEGALYFRTAPGTKLVELTANPRVALEIDEWDDDQALSVVAKGIAERLEKTAEIDAAEQLPLRPWIPTLKYRWVKITPETVSGLRFRRAAEPERF